MDDPELLKQRAIPLNSKMKSQFDRIKLADLKVPDKLANYVDEKFVRDKSEVANNMEKLLREIRNENYSDKSKLAMNVFEDFEKQESWQAYTTLLFADLAKEGGDKVNDGKGGAKGETLRPGKTSTFQQKN